MTAKFSIRYGERRVYSWSTHRIQKTIHPIALFPVISSAPFVSRAVLKPHNSYTVTVPKRFKLLIHLLAPIGKISTSINGLMSKRFFLISLCLLSLTGFGQPYRTEIRHRPVFWSELNLVYRTKGKWSFQLDHQYRRAATDNNGRDLNIFRYPLQQVFRPWISYQVSEPVRASLSPLGLWWTWSRPNRFQPTTFFQEVRVIPQLQITRPLSDGELILRLRSELRWSSGTDTLAKAYVFLSDGESRQVLADRFNVRLRLMGRWINPIFQQGKTKFWYSHLSVEPMAVLSSSVTRFDQNRTYLGLGRRLQENIRFEVGYLNQFSLQTNQAVRLKTIRLNHALQVYLYIETRSRSKAGSDSGPE